MRPKGLEMGPPWGSHKPSPSVFKVNTPLFSSVRGASLNACHGAFATGGGAMHIERGSAGFTNGRVSQDLSSPHSE